MGALLGFAPFIGFASIENLLGAVPGLAASPRFVRTNNILSGAWALAFHGASHSRPRDGAADKFHPTTLRLCLGSQAASKSSELE